MDLTVITGSTIDRTFQGVSIYYESQLVNLLFYLDIDKYLFFFVFVSYKSFQNQTFVIQSQAHQKQQQQQHLRQQLQLETQQRQQVDLTTMA